MAAQKIAEGRFFGLWYEEPASSGTYLRLCSAVTVGETQAWDMEDASVPDETNCEDPLVRRAVKRMKSSDVNFSGKLDPTKRSLLQGWFDSATSLNFRLVFNAITAEGGFRETGPFHLTNLQWGTQERGMLTFEGTLMSDGTVTREAL